MLDVSVGTSHAGSAPVNGKLNPVPGFPGRNGSATLSTVLSRGSMKNASGAAPLLVIFTGIVTGVPAARLINEPFGRPGALAMTLLNWTLPVYTCEISSPTTGSAKSTSSFQVPGT